MYNSIITTSTKSPNSLAIRHNPKTLDKKAEIVHVFHLCTFMARIGKLRMPYHISYLSPTNFLQLATQGITLYVYVKSYVNIIILQFQSASYLQSVISCPEHFSVYSVAFYRASSFLSTTYPIGHRFFFLLVQEFASWRSYGPECGDQCCNLEVIGVVGLSWYWVVQYGSRTCLSLAWQLGRFTYFVLYLYVISMYNYSQIIHIDLFSILYSILHFWIFSKDDQRGYTNEMILRKFSFLSQVPQFPPPPPAC